MPHTPAPISPLPGVVYQGEAFTVPLQVYTGRIQREVRREGSAPLAQEELTPPLSITYAIVLHADGTVVRPNSPILPSTVIFTVPVSQADTSTATAQHDIILTLVYADEVVVAAFSYQVVANPVLNPENFPLTFPGHLIIYDSLELIGDIGDSLPALGLGRSVRHVSQSKVGNQSTIVETSGKRGALFDGVDDMYTSDLNVSFDNDIGHTILMGFTAMDATDGDLFHLVAVAAQDTRMLYTSGPDAIQTAAGGAAPVPSVKEWPPPVVGQPTVYAQMNKDTSPSHRVFIDGIEATASSEPNPGATFPGVVTGPLLVGVNFMILYALYVYEPELSDAEIQQLSTHIATLMP